MERTPLITNLKLEKKPKITIRFDYGYYLRKEDCYSIKNDFHQKKSAVDLAKAKVISKLNE